MSLEIPAPGPTSDALQQQMHDTRAGLGDKVQALGDKVVGMATDAGAAIAGAMQSGKDAAQDVQDAVQSAAADGAAFVRRAVDVGGHVRRYPWLWVGGAVALGVVCGRLTRR